MLADNQENRHLKMELEKLNTEINSLRKTGSICEGIVKLNERVCRSISNEYSQVPTLLLPMNYAFELNTPLSTLNRRWSPSMK